MAASFFATVEHELLADVTLAARAATRVAIFDFITWYNGERRHSSLDYVSPVAYERHLIAHPARAAYTPRRLLGVSSTTGSARGRHARQISRVSPARNPGRFTSSAACRRYLSRLRTAGWRTR